MTTDADRATHVRLLHVADLTKRKEWVKLFTFCSGMVDTTEGEDQEAWVIRAEHAAEQIAEERKAKA